MIGHRNRNKNNVPANIIVGCKTVGLTESQFLSGFPRTGVESFAYTISHDTEYRTIKQGVQLNIGMKVSAT